MFLQPDRRDKKTKPEPTGRCQAPACDGLTYPYELVVPHSPSHFEMMHTPIGPRSSDRGPDVMRIGDACNKCGLLYAFVPDSHASEKVLARRHEERALAQQLEQDRRQRAYTDLKRLFDQHKVTVSETDLEELITSTLDEEAQPVTYSRYQPATPDEPPMAECTAYAESMGLWRTFGDAAAARIEWSTLDDAAAQRFLSRVARLFNQSQVAFHLHEHVGLSGVYEARSPFDW